MLDRVLPHRRLDALVVTLGEILLVLAVFALLVPLYCSTFQGLLRTCRALTRFAPDRLSFWGYQHFTPAAAGGDHRRPKTWSHELRANPTTLVQVAIAFLAASVFSVLGTFGFVLGFIAVPSWLLGVLTAHRAVARALDRAMPAWMRSDFWAVVRIVDRTFGSYLGGQIIRAAVFGCALYLAWCRAGPRVFSLTSHGHRLSVTTARRFTPQSDAFLP